MDSQNQDVETRAETPESKKHRAGDTDESGNSPGSGAVGGYPALRVHYMFLGHPSLDEPFDHYREQHDIPREGDHLSIHLEEVQIEEAVVEKVQWLVDEIGAVYDNADVVLHLRGPDHASAG